MAPNDRVGSIVCKTSPSVMLNDTVKSAIKVMAKTNANALMVKTGEEVVGIITEMDLMSSVVNNDDMATTTVSTIMTPCDIITVKGARNPCVQLDEDQTLAIAISIMHEAGVRNLLVTGAGDTITGIVGAKDLLKAFVE